MLTQARSVAPVDSDWAKSTNQSNVNSASGFYYPQLDGLRTLAFLLVFGNHAGGFFPDKLPLLVKLPVEAYNSVISYGWCGVDLFFVLSAFLITSLLLREERIFQTIDYKSFIIRRALRIWPLYFLMVFVGMAAFPIADPAVVSGGMRFGPSFFTHYVWTNFAWALTFTLNLGVAWGMVFVPANLMPLWSISVEEQFYLVWPLFLKLLKPTFLRVILLTVMLIVCILYRAHLMAAFPNNHVAYYLNTLTRLDPLIMGALVAIAVYKYPSIFKVNTRVGATCFIASLCVFQATASSNRQMFEMHNTTALTGFAIGWALFLVAMLTWTPAIKTFSNNLVASFGRLTYGMYVVHALVLNIIFNQLVPRLHLGFPSNESACLGLFLGLPITFGLSWFLWNAYEKRFHKLKENFARVTSGYHSSDTNPLLSLRIRTGDENECSV